MISSACEIGFQERAGLISLRPEAWRLMVAHLLPKPASTTLGPNLGWISEQARPEAGKNQALGFCPGGRPPSAAVTAQALCLDVSRIVLLPTRRKKSQAFLFYNPLTT